MNQEEFNLVSKEEVYAKSYKELLKLERELMQNPEATDLDLAFVSSVVIDRQLEMGIFKGYTIDEVFGRLLEDTSFDKKRNNNKRICKSRVRTSI